MKAAQMKDYGDASVMVINEVDKPQLKKGQVLVKVEAASLNPFDSMLRLGYMKDMIPLEMPVTLGGDIAGIVSETGEGVASPAVGDRVYGQANVVAGNSGAFAEFAATGSGQVALAPKDLDFEQTAALPLVSVSAWQALTEHIKLAKDQKIFIHGGGGGIGTIAIQIAKNIGAHIATSATGDDIAYVTQLGADEVIDYKETSFVEALNDFDAMFDTVGGDDFDASCAILKPGGVAVSMIAQPNEAKVAELGITAISQSTHVTTEALNAVRELVENGVVSARIAQVFPLEKIKEAFELRESGAAKGKVIISTSS